MAIYLKKYLSGFAITVVSSTLLLLFGEILPKSIARQRASFFTLHFSLLLRAIYFLLYPLIWFVIEISGFLLRLFGMEKESVKRFFTRKDIEMLVKEGEQVGLVNKDERGLISRCILRSNQKVRDIMIPRTEITALKENESISKVLKIFEKTGYSRLPVMGKTMDEILGFVTAKDILLKEPANLRQIMRNLLFVPETRVIANLLREMQKKRMGMAIVVDEYGGTAGLVTLEDIVEEFFGDIQDEFDEDTNLYRKIGPQQIDVNAKIHVDELNERFGLNLPVGEYKTLGGLLIEHLGRIPKRREKIEIDTRTFVILSASKKKINWVRIIR